MPGLAVATGAGNLDVDSWLARLPWWLFAALCAAAGVASFLVVYVIGK